MSCKLTIYQVIYGAQVNDPLDRQVISSMLDHFITPAACKKDYEIPKSKSHLIFLRQKFLKHYKTSNIHYIFCFRPVLCLTKWYISAKWKLPSSCFQPVRSNQISQIISQIENHPPPETFEACLMHSVAETHAQGEKGFFSQLAQIYDIEAKEVCQYMLF